MHIRVKKTYAHCVCHCPIIKDINRILLLHLSPNYLGSSTFVLDLHLSRFSLFPYAHTRSPYIIFNRIQLSLFWYFSSHFLFSVHFHNHFQCFCFLSPDHMPKPSQSILSRFVHYRR